MPAADEWLRDEYRTSFLDLNAGVPCPGRAGIYKNSAVATFVKAGYANSPLVTTGTTPAFTVSC